MKRVDGLLGRAARLLMPGLLALGLAWGCGCNNKSGGAAADLANTYDMECPPRACVAEESEDCDGCFAKIGTCCYGDTDWSEGPGTRDELVKRCLTKPGCTACCNECKQMSCEAMKKRGVCPFLQ